MVAKNQPIRLQGKETGDKCKLHARFHGNYHMHVSMVITIYERLCQNIMIYTCLMLA